MKKYVVILLALFVVGAVSAHTGHDEHSYFEQAEAIINAEIPCESLSEEQLEWLGDYYMEQMHPGEAHEVMDEMMGGEGSEELRIVHVNMAQRFYCGNTNVGMMGASNMMGYNPVYQRNNYFVSMIPWFLVGFLLALILCLLIWGKNKGFSKKRKK